MKAAIQQVHALYGQLTGQRVSLGFDRERMWFEVLRAGFTAADVARVIGYLQREIREGRRNVGALKLSNLLQLDRFEEDLNISRVQLRNPKPPVPSVTKTQPALTPGQAEAARRRALEKFAQWRVEHGL